MNRYPEPDPNDDPIEAQLALSEMVSQGVRAGDDDPLANLTDEDIALYGAVMFDEPSIKFPGARRLVP